MKPDMQPSHQSQFSEKTAAINLPANFIDVIEGLDGDQVLILVTLFQLLSNQEQECELCEAFLLREMLPTSFRDDVARWEKAVSGLIQTGLLLSFPDPQNPDKTYLIPGTPQGIKIFQDLNNQPDLIHNYAVADVLPYPDKPNLFKLYEDNFGALTPMTAEMLKADLETFPAEWIEEAMKEAVQYNARNWKYVQAILKNWQEKGRKRSNEENRRDIDEFRKLYLEQQREIRDSGTPGG